MRIRHALPLALVVVLALAPAALAQQNAEGFVSLFNGHDLSGWTVPPGDNGHWRVADGVIDYDAGSESSGDKCLWSEREFGDFVLQVDWRLKEAPFLNKSIPYILPDGTHARDIKGQEMHMALPDSDSGIFLRGDGNYQVNIWCWPIGSGELYGVRTNPKTAPEVRAAVTPRTQADKPVGEWNHFEITVKGSTISVVLNGKLVIPGATIPDLPKRGRLALQHHGSKAADGTWAGPPSLVQFRNIAIKELPVSATSAAIEKPLRGLVITGGHDFDPSFFSTFEGCKELGSLERESPEALKADLRERCDVLILYNANAEIDEATRKNLEDFLAAGKGIVVLHHALLNYQASPRWTKEVVGGSYRLNAEGGRPSSTYKEGVPLDVVPAGEHPVLKGVKPFHVVTRLQGAW